MLQTKRDEQKEQRYWKHITTYFMMFLRRQLIYHSAERSRHITKTHKVNEIKKIKSDDKGPSNYAVVWLTICHNVMRCSFTICKHWSTRKGHINEHRKPRDIQNPKTLPICHHRHLIPSPWPGSLLWHRVNFVWLTKPDEIDTDAANQSQIQPICCEGVMVN